MSRKNTKVLVINRLVSDEADKKHDLKPYIRLLRAYGYAVKELATPPGNMEQYDIVVAHPPWNFIEEMEGFHRQYPQIPMVIFSGMKKGVDFSSYSSGFYLDCEGIYVGIGPEMKEFMSLMKRLSSQAYRSGIQ